MTAEQKKTLISEFDSLVVFEKTETAAEFFRDKNLTPKEQLEVMQHSLGSLWARELEVETCQ